MNGWLGDGAQTIDYRILNKSEQIYGLWSAGRGMGTQTIDHRLDIRFVQNSMVYELLAGHRP